MNPYPVFTPPAYTPVSHYHNVPHNLFEAQLQWEYNRRVLKAHIDTLPSFRIEHTYFEEDETFYSTFPDAKLAAIKQWIRDRYPHLAIDSLHLISPDSKTTRAVSASPVSSLYHRDFMQLTSSQADYSSVINVQACHRGSPDDLKTPKLSSCAASSPVIATTMSCLSKLSLTKFSSPDKSTSFSSPISYTGDWETDALANVMIVQKDTSPSPKVESPVPILEKCDSPSVVASPARRQRRKYHKKSQIRPRHQLLKPTTPRVSSKASNDKVEPGATQDGQPAIRLRDRNGKPLVACIFCRGRKIACGAAPPEVDDDTCDQCARRNLKCSFPKENRRGIPSKRKESSKDAAKRSVKKRGPKASGSGIINKKARSKVLSTILDTDGSSSEWQ